MRTGETGEAGRADHAGGRRAGNPCRPPSSAPEARRLYDAITQGPRATGPQHFALTREDGALNGPFNAFLLSPGLGAALRA